ncbi:MAG: RluA family pseudouridine synthase [Clostridia bacterium]|nr:RluA family pseudouridine synthase [Clostridia bacterium]
MPDATEFTVRESGERLDVFLSRVAGKTRSQIARYNDDGNVLVNGERGKCGRILKAGDIVSFTAEERAVNALPEELPLDILYEDDDIAVLNKRQGMSVHPGAGNASGTLVNALLWRFGSLSEAGGQSRPGIVHRLDKDTSGVLVVAKNDRAHLALSAQWSSRQVRKIYLALLEGNLRDDEGKVCTCIGRSTRDRKKMAVLPQGKEAITLYRVCERFAANCLAEFDIRTGRTHQIRVHAQYLGHPVVGDKTYGYAKQKFALNGQLLHAYKITFLHPATGEEKTFCAPLPDYFENVLKKLRNQKEKEVPCDSKPQS